MKKAALALLLCGLIVSATCVRAQDKPKSETADKADKKVEEKIPAISLRVQAVFNDYDGDKKIASLPYTLLISTGSPGLSSIRMDLRVPIPFGDGSERVTTYDINTNIDGRADRMEDGRYKLHLNLDRTSVYSPNKGTALLDTNGSATNEKVAAPVIQMFRTAVDLLMRDGQTIQSTVATDPLSGHVIKVDVTLNVVK